MSLDTAKCALEWGGGKNLLWLRITTLERVLKLAFLPLIFSLFLPRLVDKHVMLGNHFFPVYS